jgi:hypothetical protein
MLCGVFLLMQRLRKIKKKLSWRALVRQLSRFKVW